MRSVYSLSAKELESKGQWVNLLKFIKKGRKDEIKMADKVRVAKHYTENNAPNLDILDLKKRVKQLTDFIERCNEYNAIALNE
ncbi:hypothetical protein DA717_12050 [Piscirickettsiaceae bacterium NZ-RLO2]|nr:hypothetical protein DA717_12050 [Piscirickettsiaceae bacterium NZ-RLO2]